MEGKAIEMKPIVGKKKVTEKKVSSTNIPATQVPKEDPINMEDRYKGLVSQLYERNQQLVEALNEKNTAMMFKRLDYLFKVLDLSHMFDDEFVTKCIDELQKTLDLTQGHGESTENGE